MTRMKQTPSEQALDVAAQMLVAKASRPSAGITLVPPKEFQSWLDYAVATNTRSGLVTLRLTLAEAGETITLLQQVHVDNAP